jgi:hypothetical protein
MRSATARVQSRRDVKPPVLLAQIANHVIESLIDVPESTVRAIVRACSPIQDDAKRADAWSEYLARVTVERDLMDGRITWQDIADDLTCIDKSQAALDIAVERSNEALDVLVGRTPETTMNGVRR